MFFATDPSFGGSIGRSLRGEPSFRDPYTYVAPHEPGRILQAEGGAERVELLLQLHVPAPSTPACHHGSLRVLPRSRRRRRRDERAWHRAREARVVAGRGARHLRRRATAPGRARLAERRRFVPSARDALPGRDRRHGDGPRAQPLSRLHGPRGLLLSRRGRGRPHVSRNLRLYEPRDAAIRAGSRHRVPVDQHRSRRRRRRTPRTHLRAAKRSGPPRRDRRVGAAMPGWRCVPRADGGPSHACLRLVRSRVRDPSSRRPRTAKAGTHHGGDLPRAS